MQRRKIGFISCSKSKKEGTYKAEELYDSSLFKAALNYCKKNYDEVYILSAKFGILELSDEIDNYDETLVGASQLDIKRWSNKVLLQLRDRYKKKQISSSDKFYFHTGKNYYKYLRPKIPNTCIFPIEEDKNIPRASIGFRMAWYKKEAESGSN